MSAVMKYMGLLLVLFIMGCQDTFIRGVSFSSLPANCVADLQSLGCNAIHYRIPWNQIEPVVGGEFTWEVWDMKIRGTYAGFTQSAIIGGVNVFDMPMLGSGDLLSPDSVGWDAFLVENYDFIYLTVSRYREDIDLWWIMPEMNEARLRMLFGWLDGGVYWYYERLDELVSTQYAAVKDASPSSQVGIIYHTGIHPDIHHDHRPVVPNGSQLAGQFDYLEMMDRWNGYQDVIGIDNYPNYYTALPVAYNLVSLQAIEACRFGKSVFVTETQYPYSRESLPSPVQFSEEYQAEYLYNCYRAVRGAALSNRNIAGFFMFNLYASGVRNNYSSEDLEALTTVGSAFGNGNAKVLIDYMFANYVYCSTRLPIVLQYVERGLGVKSGEYRTLGWYALQSAFKGE